MSQVKVIAVCSFPYKYKQRQVYLTTGETLYLDNSKDKDEIAYLLSESFPYREFIYIEGSDYLANNPTKVQEDLHLVPMLPLYNPYPDQMPYTTPPLDAPENPHVLETLQAAGVVLPPDDGGAVGQPIFGLSASENPALSIPIVNSQLGRIEPLGSSDTIEKLPEPPQAVKEPPKLEPPTLTEKEKRAQELKHMSVNKVKDLAKTYNLEFISKQETIAQVLDLEFPNPNA